MSDFDLRPHPQAADWYEAEIKKIDPLILELKLARPALRVLVNESIYTVKKLRIRSAKN